MSSFPEFRASDKEMEDPCPLGVHGSREGQKKQSSTMLDDGTETEAVPGQPASPEDIGLSLGAFTCRKSPCDSLLLCANLGFLVPTPSGHLPQ